MAVGDSLVQRFCPSCERIQLFETPLCADGHGQECPELVCVACGAALVIGSAPADPSRRSGARPDRVA